MLFVDVEENLRTMAKRPEGLFYSSVMSGVISRIKEASVFVLDQNATAMCANVFFSRPSSIISALEYVRLPAPSVWIEYSNLAAREAFARLGNENQWVEGAVFIEKTGLLLTQGEGVIDMEAVAQYRRDDGPSIIELMSARCTFDTTPGIKLDPDARRQPHKIEHSATGQAKRYYDLLSRDEKEVAAKDEIRGRFAGSLHPDWAKVASLTPNEAMRDSISKMLTGHLDDIFRMFTTQILPSLILMNCRNAVEEEYVDAPAKLNKARKAKGRPEIGPYRIVKLKLRPKQRRIYEERGYTGVQMAGGLVIGHFKVRKTGVFWWSPYLRGKILPSGPKTVHMVTA